MTQPETIAEITKTGQAIAAEVRANSAPIMEYVESLVITEPRDLEVAGEALKRIKKRIKAVEAERKKMTDPLNKAKTAIMDFFRGPIETLKQAEAGLKGKIGAYTEERERIRLEAERKAREEAEAERRRLQAEAEKARREAEELAAKDAKAAEEARLKAAETEMAADLVETKTPDAAPSVDGLSKRVTWHFEITDPAQVPDEFKTIDEKRLGEVARTMKERASVPGVRFFSKTSVAVRT